MAYEKRYSREDEFLRFTNNTDYEMMESMIKQYGVDPEFLDLLIAFSHWTYEASVISFIQIAEDSTFYQKGLIFSLFENLKSLSIQSKMINVG